MEKMNKYLEFFKGYVEYGGDELPSKMIMAGAIAQSLDNLTAEQQERIIDIAWYYTEATKLIWLDLTGVAMAVVNVFNKEYKGNFERFSNDCYYKYELFFDGELSSYKNYYHEFFELIDNEYNSITKGV